MHIHPISQVRKVRHRGKSTPDQGGDKSMMEAKAALLKTVLLPLCTLSLKISP